MDTNIPSTPKKILILAANPNGNYSERLGKELRDISEGLRRSQKRDEFTLQQELAVRPKDIRRAMLDVKPQIVHFSGHGTEDEGLVFEDEVGHSKLISGDALAGLFKLFDKQIELECVVLNGCYSEVQAKAIAQHIKYVVGMSKKIGDKAAIEFAVGFYDALGAGESIEFAYNLGCNAIQMAGIEEQLTPVLLKKEESGNVKIISNFQEGEKLKKSQLKWLQIIPTRSIFTTIGTSLGVTILVVILRLLGMFRPVEFFFFDQMMRYKSPEKADDKLLIIQITPQDINYYSKDNPPKNSSSLADRITYKLLDKLLQAGPRVIGIDKYRYAKAESDLEKLIKDERLIFICKFPDKNANDEGGHDPPPDVDMQQVGLSDFVKDPDGVIRRQIIQMGTPNNKDTNEVTKCRNEEELMDSFSFKVAQKYLAVDNKEYKISGEENQNIVSGKTVLQPLNIDMQSGLALRNLNGTQVLLNYRFTNDENNKPSVINIARTFTIRQVLNGIDKDYIKDKIILIGTPIQGYDPPSNSTPFSVGKADTPMSGLFIQAQMVSQLVNAVTDKRPLLKVWHISHDIVWILGWSVTGAILARLLYKHPQKLLMATGFCFITLYITCLVFFIKPIISRTKFWIPLVPTAVSFVVSGGMIVFFDFKFQKKSDLN